MDGVILFSIQYRSVWLTVSPLLLHNLEQGRRGLDLKVPPVPRRLQSKTWLLIANPSSDVALAMISVFCPSWPLKLP